MADTSQSHPIACRVLESHASADPAAVIVLFHQKEHEDQTELGSMLRQHSGEVAQIQVEGGKWLTGTVVRLKSCFGRGLLLLPAGAPPMKEGDAFLLSFRADREKN